MFRKYTKKVITQLADNNYQTLNVVQVSRQRILDNFNMFKKPGLSVVPVLKSNAYGHGLERVAEILNAADCPFLAVDGYFEAAKIRDISNHQILVLGYILPKNAALLDTKKCSFVISDMEYLRALSKLGKPVQIHLEINTGMNRMGIQPEEVQGYLSELSKYPNLNLEGLMTHLADADNPASESFNESQIEQFDKLVGQVLSAGFKPEFIHAAQTAGSTKTRSKYANAMRLGIGLYGINPLSTKDRQSKTLDELQPALELKSTIVKTITLKRGDKVSYGLTFTAPAAMKIAVLPLGYYEGLPRELSNKGCVMYRQERLPIVGRICMNHTMVDISGTSLTVGSEIIVISNDSKAANSVKNICAANKLFSYSLLAGLSSTIRRSIT